MFNLSYENVMTQAQLNWQRINSFIIQKKDLLEINYCLDIMNLI